MKKLLTALLFVALSFTGCEKDDDDQNTPYITLTNLKQDSGDPAVYVNLSYGYIKCHTNTPEAGVVWATSTNPTITNNKVISVSQCYSQTGGNVKLSGVPAKTLIYIRGYSLTSESPGVMYSSEMTITTK